MIGPGEVMDLLIDDIYDAGVSPDRWPALLDRLALAHGARGAALFHATDSNSSMIISPRIEGFANAYHEGGWMSPNVRGERMLLEHAPCFQTDSDYWSPQQMASMPVYRDFLVPAGYATGVGIAIQGTSHDMLGLTLEGMACDAAARQMLPRLDRLRPHLARAASLSMRLGCDWSHTAVAALDMAGTGAAIIAPDGRLRAANACFGTSMGDRATEMRGRLRFRHAGVASRIDEVAQRAACDREVAVSIPIPPSDDRRACVLHLIPLRRRARVIFESDGLLLVVADPDNRAMPEAGILRLLFDLTPAEAALASELAGGHSLQEAASRRAILHSTARAQLRSIFLKTNCRRQGELVCLLTGLTGHRADLYA
jgi:DNA-binding CsgD family transcriptional regulator